MANEEIGVVLTAGVDVREEAGLPEEGTLVLTSVGGGRWETTVWGVQGMSAVRSSPDFLGGDGEL